MYATSTPRIRWLTSGVLFLLLREVLPFASLAREYLYIANSGLSLTPDSFGYCIKVYLSSMLNDDKTETQSSMGLPSYTNSVNTRSPRAIYRRVRKVLYLQWRGITIVVFILVDVIFFSVVFIWLNSITSHATDDIESALPFLVCLMKNPIDHEVCTEQAEILFVNNETVIAVLLMLSVCDSLFKALLHSIWRTNKFYRWLAFNASCS